MNNYNYYFVHVDGVIFDYFKLKNSFLTTQILSIFVAEFIYI